jgi:hypothetical protein
MSLTDEQRDELLAARDAWGAARDRYGQEAEKYVVAWFHGEKDVNMPEQLLDRDGLDTLTRLNADILAAQAEYAAVLERIQGQG